MVSLELVYLFAGGALVVGLLLGAALGLALGGRGGPSPAPPPRPRVETGVALTRDPEGAWWIEVGRQRYRHLREIHDHPAAMLVLEAFRAVRAMLEGSEPLPLAVPGGLPLPAEQLNRVFQDLLLERPDLSPPPVCFETRPDGSLAIVAGGTRYERLEDVVDPALRDLLREAVRRWAERPGSSAGAP